MNSTLNRLWVTVLGFTLLLLALSACADELEDAKKFYADKNYAKAAELFKESALHGNVEAQATLGTLYEYGQGVAQNNQEAILWYRKAADQGSVEAQDKLGLMYDEGRGVAQDYQQAAFWYRKAADKGLADAEFHLGRLYDNGKGVGQSYHQAAFWYEKAALGGHGIPAAKYNLGLLYEYGRGVPQDYVQALFWYSGAATQNLASAQFKLGWLQETGDKGAGQSYTIAASWYQKAADQGYALAQPQLDLLKSNIQTPCDKHDTEYSTIRANEEFPLKPGLWKFQTFLVSRQVTVKNAEKQTCFAEKTLCISEHKSLPTVQFWPALKSIANNHRFDGEVYKASDSVFSSYIDWESNDPILSVRIVRIKQSADQYTYKEYIRMSDPWMQVATGMTEEHTIDRMAIFVGACPKPE
jgi:TPR repeat protein